MRWSRALAGLNPTASLVYNPAPPLTTIITRSTHDGKPRSQAYSEDGTRWTFGGTAFSNRVRFFAEGHDAGEEGAKPQSVSAAATSYTYRFSRRERPHLVFGDAAAPTRITALTTGVQFGEGSPTYAPGQDACFTLLQPVNQRDTTTREPQR